MEKVSTNITTNQSAITTTQPPSAMCNTCTDSMILNGVLGGILFVALIPVAICFCKKRISEFIFKTNYLYEVLLVILPIVSGGLSLSTGITLIINCVKINPIQCPVGYGWIGMVCFVFLDLVASIGITVYLKHRKSIYDKKNQRDQEVQDLRTFIESAYELCETAKEELNFIKETVFIDQAEKKEQQLQKSVMEWNTTITKADQLEKKLRKARKKDSVPLISDPLETEIQRTRPKNENQRIINYIKYLKDARDKDVQHDNNIGGFTHEAEQEIKFKKEVQDLRTFIESSYELCERAKEELNFIKETVFIDQAEKKEQQLQKSVMEWNTTITKADQLEKELRKARKRDSVPLISDPLETEIQRTRPKNENQRIINYIQYLKDARDKDVQHDNNIGGFTHEAEQEIKFKKEELSSGVLKSWIEDDKTFCSTKATEYIYKQAEKHRKVLVSGVSGIGKSANVHHIALQLKDKGYRIFRVQRATKMIEMIDKLGEDKQVYVFDDVFGVHGVVEDKRKSWSDENRKDDLERCLENPNVIILCTSRLQVILDDKLSSIKSHFTIINMSQGDTELTDDERVEIFRKHAIAKQRGDLLLKNKDHLTNKVEQEIRQVKCPLGCYPLVCRLFTGDKETKKTMDEYFSKPLKVIAEILDKLRNEEPIRHFCLLLCLIYDNKLPVNTIEVAYESEQDERTKQLRKELLLICELPSSTLLQTIKNKMDTLFQTFVKLEGDAYLFVHDIIYDAVIKHVSGLSSSVHKVIMRHCSSTFMRDRVHLSGVVCKDRYGRPGHDTESCINIRPDSFTCWGIRVLDIVRDGVRTSDQLYNDIDEGRCSRRDRRVVWDNPWRDVFVYNRCVHSTEGQDAIVQALKSSDVQTIMCTKGYRLSLGGDPRVTGLHWAMEEGLTHIATQTLSMLSPTQLREVVSIHDGGLLCVAIRGECGTDVIQALIVGGADVNTPDVDGRTPLHWSVSLGDYKITQLLVDNGADINQCDKDGKSVLYKSQLYGYDTITELLQSRGAVCMYKGKQYNHVTDIPDLTLFDFVLYNNYQAVKIRIERGDDVNRCDMFGISVLCRSQLRGHDTITELLQSRGAVCIYEGKRYNHVTDIPDFTLLDFVWSNNYQAVKILIERGVDVNQCDKYGTSVLCRSQLEGHDTITELLQSRGAVCMYNGKRYTTITDIPDSEVNEWERERIQELKEKQNVTK